MLLSADAHIMEPSDLFTRQLPRQDHYRAPVYERLPNGLKIFKVNGMVSSISPEFMRRVDGSGAAVPMMADDVDGYIADLEADGVWGAVLHPNIGLAIFEIADSAFALRCAQIYNDHVGDVYSSERFFPGAVIPLNVIDDAVSEIQRIAKLGFRVIELPLHAPPEGPYFSHRYDPVWEAAQTESLVISMHVGSGRTRGSDSGAAAIAAVSFGRPTGSDRWPENDPDHLNAIVSIKTATGGFGGYGGQVLDTIPSLVGGGVLERFSTLRFMMVETGARWLLNVMDTMDEAWHVGPGVNEVNRIFLKADGSQVQQFHPDELGLGWPYPLMPSQYVRRQLHTTFQDDWVALRNRQFTGIEPLVWGNDYPHNEGCWPKSAEAIEAQCERAGVSPAERALIFGGTLARLLCIEGFVDTLG